MSVPGGGGSVHFFGAVFFRLNSGKKKAHKHKLFCGTRWSSDFTGFVPGTNPVCHWDKSGEKLGQAQDFSLFYTVEARFHQVCPWHKPGLSLGQSRGRRSAQKVYVKKLYVPFSLAINCISRNPLFSHGFGVTRFLTYPPAMQC